jgi:hypothetical protein
VLSSDTAKGVHCAVKQKMKVKVSFKLIGERHGDMWIDGVQLDLQELLIYLINIFGLEGKAGTIGCEIVIAVVGRSSMSIAFM